MSFLTGRGHGDKKNKGLWLWLMNEVPAISDQQLIFFFSRLDAPDMEIS